MHSTRHAVHTVCFTCYFQHTVLHWRISPGTDSSWLKRCERRSWVRDRSLVLFSLSLYPLSCEFLNRYLSVALVCTYMYMLLGTNSSRKHNYVCNMYVFTYVYSVQSYSLHFAHSPSFPIYVHMFLCTICTCVRICTYIYLYIASTFLLYSLFYSLFYSSLNPRAILSSLFPSFLSVPPLPPPAPTRKQCTVAIIKPDAVANGVVEDILAQVEAAGLEVLCQEERTLTREEAEDFYKQHEGSVSCGCGHSDCARAVWRKS